MKCIECGVDTRFGDLKYGVCSNCRNKEKESLGIVDEKYEATKKVKITTAFTFTNFEIEDEILLSDRSES